MRRIFFMFFVPDTTPAVFLSLPPCLMHTYQPLHQPAEGYSHPSGFHPTSLPSLCGQSAVMPLSCLQQIPPWQKNYFLSFWTPFPSLPVFSFPKETQNSTQANFFPSSLPKVAAAQKRGEKGKTVQRNDRSHIMEHS